MNQSTSDEQNSEQSVIRFAISDQEFAIPADAIVEVIELPAYTQVPQTPSYVAGIFIRKGRVVAVLDLQAWLGLSDVRLAGRKALVIERREFIIAIQVDHVFGLEELAFLVSDDLRFGLTNRVNDLTSAVNNDAEDQLIALLDLDALLTATTPSPS